MNTLLFCLALANMVCAGMQMINRNYPMVCLNGFATIMCFTALIL